MPPVLVVTARPRPGARRCLWRGVGTLAMAVLLAAGPVYAWDREAGTLPWRVGGLAGFAVDAAAFPDSAGTRLEVYVRIRPATIAALVEGRTHSGPLRLEVRLRSGRRGAEQRAVQELTFAVADTLPGYGRVVLLPFRVVPGPHRLAVRLESQRRLLPGRGEGKPDAVEVTGAVEVPGPQAGGDLSDIEFVWPSPGARTSGEFRRGPLELLPNAERLYGLLAAAPRAAFTARARPGDARAWRWVARIEDAAGHAVALRESAGPAAEWLHGLAEFEAATMPAGAYTLEVKAWQEGDAGALTRRAAFSVGWESDTWLRDPSDLHDEVHFLLRQDEEERFELLPAGEQERVIAEYWRSRDPTPGTAVNELRARFLERVSFANQTYGRYGLGKGMFSDMGRVFIRYGEPSEVHRSVIPGPDRELETVIERYVKIHDRPVGDVGDPTAGADMRPFEIWVYEGEVELPFDADRSVGARRRLGKPLIFLFIDEQWLGDYRLRYSNE